MQEEVLNRENFFRKNYFLIYVTIFVVVISFFVGISIGLKRVKAREHNIFNTGYYSRDYVFQKIKPADELELVPLGRDVEINGKQAELASFFSDKKVQDIIEKQKQKWQAEGFDVVGMATSKRGFALAVNKEKLERFSIYAWFIPEALRESLTKDKAVRGLISYASMQGYNNSGLVPGVPLMSEGNAGALISSDEGGYRSYVGVYTNPAKISDNVNFYRDYFNADRWLEEGSSSLGSFQGNIANLVFKKENEEITLLFSALSEDKTVINIIRVSRY